MTTETEPMGEVVPEIINQAIGSLDRYILNHYGRPTRRTLRERQITVFESLRDTLRGGANRGVHNTTYWDRENSYLHRIY